MEEEARDNGSVVEREEDRKEDEVADDAFWW